MSETATEIKENSDETLQKERTRLAELIFKKSDKMVAEYRALIQHTGGLLTSSMVYAYQKGIQDTIKTILKESQKNV